MTSGSATVTCTVNGGDVPAVDGNPDATTSKLLGVEMFGATIKGRGEQIEIIGDFLGIDTRFLVDLNTNAAETYTEQNGTPGYNLAESFAEPYEDVDGNGQWNADEPFEDWNGNEPGTAPNRSRTSTTTASGMRTNRSRTRTATALGMRAAATSRQPRLGRRRTLERRQRQLRRG